MSLIGINRTQKWLIDSLFDHGYDATHLSSSGMNLISIDQVKDVYKKHKKAELFYNRLDKQCILNINDEMYTFFVPESALLPASVSKKEHKDIKKEKKSIKVQKAEIQKVLNTDQEVMVILQDMWEKTPESMKFEQDGYKYLKSHLHGKEVIVPVIIKSPKKIEKNDLSIEEQVYNLMVDLSKKEEEIRLLSKEILKLIEGNENFTFLEDVRSLKLAQTQKVKDKYLSHLQLNKLKTLIRVNIKP